VSENRVLRRVFGPRMRKRQRPEEDCIMRSITKYYLDEMDRACSTRGRDEKCIQNFGQKT
jgi:hypothetical protein